MCGWNNKGQLGLGDTQDRSVLCHVQGVGPVRRVSCGWNHTLLITGNTWSPILLKVSDLQLCRV